MPIPSVLDAFDLHVTFGQTRALRGMSLHLGRGEAVALVGPSGCGKSTLLNVLAGILSVDEGEVRFLGEPMPDADRDRTRLRRDHFGFVMQSGVLVPEMSLLDNVSMPALLRGRSAHRARAEAIALLDRFGLAEHAHKRSHEVSGGQLQRAAVARALCGSPDVVFADEPTGALDSHNGDLVMAALLEGVREHDVCLLLVTHDLARTGGMDRVVRMRDGQEVTPG